MKTILFIASIWIANTLSAIAQESRAVGERTSVQLSIRHTPIISGSGAVILYPVGASDINSVTHTQKKIYKDRAVIYWVYCQKYDDGIGYRYALWGGTATLDVHKPVCAEIMSWDSKYKNERWIMEVDPRTSYEE